MRRPGGRAVGGTQAVGARLFVGHVGGRGVNKTTSAGPHATLPSASHGPVGDRHQSRSPSRLRSWEAGMWRPRSARGVSAEAPGTNIRGGRGGEPRQAALPTTGSATEKMDCGREAGPPRQTALYRWRASQVLSETESPCSDPPCPLLPPLTRREGQALPQPQSLVPQSTAATCVPHPSPKSRRRRSCRMWQPRGRRGKG